MTGPGKNPLGASHGTPREGNRREGLGPGPGSALSAPCGALQHASPLDEATRRTERILSKRSQLLRPPPTPSYLCFYRFALKPPPF